VGQHLDQLIRLDRADRQHTQNVAEPVDRHARTYSPSTPFNVRLSNYGAPSVLAEALPIGQSERVARRVRSALSAVLMALTVVVSCTDDSPTKSERVKAALDGLNRGARLPQQVVDNTGVPATSNLINNVVGVKRLKRLEYRECAAGSALDVYAVTGDADALWQRMLRSGERLSTARTEAAGRRIRYLHQSGFDYDVEVALSQGSRLGPLLAVRSCG
jgi:hypothetical protein